VEEYPPAYAVGYIFFGTAWKPFIYSRSCRREAAEIYPPTHAGGFMCFCVGREPVLFLLR
jgi:hypothetical protein